MAELITGDTTKGIKSVGELALRISRFDSYRLFTLYENVRERKLMDVSGNQKYYLVFKSPKKEIRIPEYDPKGFFEVDKVNGCILFKITKKNAEDILSMKTGGDKIFHIIRVFEETDAYGKVLNVTDEVEVYNGKWGDDEAFSAFSTENKVDLLTKALAVQVDKNANLLNEYNDLLEKYNDEVKKTSDLEKEAEALRAERDSLQSTLNDYLGSTYDGTVLSTDTKYIAFQNTLDNITLTEEQTAQMANELMTKGEFDMSNIDIDEPRVELKISVYENIKDLKIELYKNGISMGSAAFNENVNKILDVNDGDVFTFKCTGVPKNITKHMYVTYAASNENYNTTIEEEDGVKLIAKAVKFSKNSMQLISGGNNTITGTIDFTNIDPVGNIGVINCYIQ